MTPPAFDTVLPAVVLFAHGSRDAHWRDPIEAVAALMRQRQPLVEVRCAYLELCAPTLLEAASDLIALGARSVRVFPLFLGVGKHAREDLPTLMQSLQCAYPNVEFELLAAAGERAEVTRLLADLALG